MLDYHRVQVRGLPVNMTDVTFAMPLLSPDFARLPDEEIIIFPTSCHQHPVLWTHNIPWRSWNLDMKWGKCANHHHVDIVPFKESIILWTGSGWLRLSLPAFNVLKAWQIALWLSCAMVPWRSVPDYRWKIAGRFPTFVFLGGVSVLFEESQALQTLQSK